jgi:integrase
MWEMEQQRRRGFLLDALPWADPLDPASLAGEMRSFHQNPSSVYDAPEKPIQDQTEEDGTWLPLNDEWLQAAGFRWIYLLTNILPNLLRIAEDWADLNERSRSRRKAHVCHRRAPLTHATAKDKLNAKRRAYLAAFDWRDKEDRPLTELPFEIAGRNNLPTLWADLKRLVNCVQRSLYSLLLLLTAGRRSEISTLRRSGSLIEVVDENAGLAHLSGRTFKLSGFGVGDETFWPLPLEIGEALKSWIAFTRFAHPESERVWMSWSSKRDKLPDVGAWPDSLNKLFGLNSLAGGVPVHAHRFRKTMARLAVLCLVGAPMILMQILGHDSLVTTLKYIFSDPHIRDELALVLQELRLEIAVMVAEGLDESGGRGAETLRQARDNFIAGLKVSSNERAQRYRARDFAAAHLAEGGVDLKVVFAGLICLKPGDMPGRCSRHTLEADISRCETECPYFLALPSAKTWTRTTLEWLIAELQDTDVQNNPLLLTFYRAQFVDQARIFEDLRLEYAEYARSRALLPTLLQNRLESPK